MSRNKKTLIALVVVLALGGLAWALMPPGPDPQLVKVQQLQEKLFNAKLADADRRKAFGELRQEAEKLSPEQQMQLMRDNPMAKRMQKTVVEYFDTPEDKRVALLDKQIDEMERMRKQFEKQAAERHAKGEGGPGPGRGWGNRGSMDQNQQNQMRKRMLDNSSPQERAMFSEYFKQMQDRRSQRGLPTFGGRGGF